MGKKRVAWNRGLKCPGIGVCGEKHHHARLTEDIVRKIRKKYLPYRFSCRWLASRYGVSSTTIWNVVSYNAWKHVRD